MAPKTVTLLFVCAVAIAGLPGPGEQSSSGQQPGNRKPACTCFCGGGSPESFNLFDADEIKAGKCFGGPLPADRCGDSFKSLPEEKQKSFCAKLKAEGKSTASCPVLKTLAQYCEPEEKKPPDVKCESPRDDFNPGGASDEFNPFDCKNLQRVQISILRDSVEAHACGRLLIRIFGSSRKEIDKIATQLGDKAPSKICCDRLSADETVGSEGSVSGTTGIGFPDGRPGSTTYQDTDFYHAPAGSTFEPMPPGMRIADILPDMACAGCKWELVKGDAKCEPRGRNAGLFWYEATWRCPTTGVEVWKPSNRRILQQQCK